MGEAALVMPSMNEGEFGEFFATLSEAEQLELHDNLMRGPRVAPLEGPQTEAFESEADVLGYGGAAGGGKSGLACLLALLEHKRSVIFRFEKEQMAGMVEDLIEFHGTQVGLNRQLGQFHLGPGRLIEWGGLGKPGSEKRWQGRPHDLMVVDEATEVAFSKIMWLKTWNRSAVAGQRCRIVFMFNPPGGPEDEGGGAGRWVIDYFAPWLDERHPDYPEKPGKLRYYLRDENGVEREVSGPDDVHRYEVEGRELVIHPESRTFIPARVWDNKFLMADNNYLSTLNALEEPFRSKYLLGDFRSGILDADCQVIPSKWLDAAFDRYESKYGSGEHDFGELDALGIDVARGGRDDSVFGRRYGWVFPALKRIKGEDTWDGKTVGVPALEIVDKTTAKIFIDSNGVGSSPYDYLKDKWVTEGVSFHGKAGEMQMFEDAHRFWNMRAALWWVFRRALDPARGLNLMIRNDGRLRSELLAPRYYFKGGKMLIEEKDEIRKRLGHSTDSADSVILTLRNIREMDSHTRLLPKDNKVDFGEVLAGERRQDNVQHIGESWMGI